MRNMEGGGARSPNFAIYMRIRVRTCIRRSMESTFKESLDLGGLEQLPKEFYWLNGPPKFEFSSQGSGAGLRISPGGQTDFWQKTFYTPPLIKSNGPALLRKVPDGLAEWSAEVNFSLENATNQFDQAGIMVYADEEHWMKAGVEVVDGVPSMSCVVTNVWSDWSVQPWRSATNVSIRVSYTNSSFALQYKSDEEKWQFYRIAPSMVSQQAGVGVGMLCCSPKQAGMTAVFHSFSVSDRVSFDHHS